MEKKYLFQKYLLDWWEKNGLKYPWRSYKDPFWVLISEILLRKTNAEKVKTLIPVTLKIISSPAKIIELEKDKLEDLLRPYGLYRRKTIELKKISNIILEIYKGNVPDDYELLITLPGVGTYIANAVMCFAFEEKRPIIDTNVIRIFKRFFLLKSKRTREREDPLFWEFAGQIIPNKRFKEYNYALLDFAKLICKAKNPSCQICPFFKECDYSNLNHLNKS